jgi:hypothetical protein
MVIEDYFFNSLNSFSLAGEDYLLFCEQAGQVEDDYPGDRRSGEVPKGKGPRCQVERADRKRDGYDDHKVEAQQVGL